MATQINFFYQQYATQFMTIDEDANGLFCTIPSESNGESYNVRCEESDTEVVVKSCNCIGHRVHGHCKHAVIVQNFWNKTYRTNIAKAEIKALEASMDQADAIEEAYELAEIAEQVQAAPVAPKAVKIRKVRKVATPKVRKVGNKLVLVKAPAPIAKVIEQSVQAVLPAPNKDMMKAPLTTNRGFQLMR